MYLSHLMISQTIRISNCENTIIYEYTLSVVVIIYIYIYLHCTQYSVYTKCNIHCIMYNAHCIGYSLYVNYI